MEKIKIKSWDDLGQIIMTMTPDQRKSPVIFLEGYDDFKVCVVSKLTFSDESFKNKDGQTVPAQQPYMEE